MSTVVALAAVVLAVVAVGGAAVVRRRARADVARSRDEVAAATGARDAARAEADRLRGETEDLRAETERLRAEAADLRAGSDQLRAEVERLRAETGRLAADLATATSSGHDPRTLWHLELARSERTWRHHVAPGIGVPAPFDGGEPALLVAARIDASALREETGTGAEVVWQVVGEPGPAASLAALRRVQELLAAAARWAEHVDVVLTGPADAIVVTATGVDGDGVHRPVVLDEACPGSDDL